MHPKQTMFQRWIYLSQAKLFKVSAVVHVKQIAFCLSCSVGLLGPCYPSAVYAIELLKSAHAWGCCLRSSHCPMRGGCSLGWTLLFVHIPSCLWTPARGKVPYSPPATLVLSLLPNFSPTQTVTPDVYHVGVKLPFLGFIPTLLLKIWSKDPQH